MAENIEQEHERLSQPVTLEDLDQALEEKDLEIDHGVVSYRIHKDGPFHYRLFADSEETTYQDIGNLLVALSLEMGVLKPHESNPIDLYETKEGDLYLHQRGDSLVYGTLPPTRSVTFFNDDCRDIRDGDTSDWLPNLVYGYAEMQATLEDASTTHVATWYHDKPYVLHRKPGRNGQHYLNIAE